MCIVHVYIEFMVGNRERSREGENPNVWPQMVVPSLPTLLSHSSIQHPCDFRPFLYAEPADQLHQQPAK